MRQREPCSILSLQIPECAIHRLQYMQKLERFQHKDVLQNYLAPKNLTLKFLYTNSFGTVYDLPLFQLPSHSPRSISAHRENNSL